jgi:sulfite reductase (NADPH) flavoprotein alpha-component
MPAIPPLLALPEMYRDWDEIVEELPWRFRSLRIREAFDELPVLPVDAEHLPDRYLCRASSMLSMFSHAYWRGKPTPPAALPPVLGDAWNTVSTRLGRPAPFLSYIDLIVYNWKLVNPDLPDPYVVENMELLIPTVGSQEEHVFHLTQVEILAQTAPLVGAIVRAQEAAERQDVEALEQELLLMLDRMHHAGEVSFQKISPNPRSATFVDAVVWSKTVAPFAVPITQGVLGPAGPPPRSSTLSTSSSAALPTGQSWEPRPCTSAPPTRASGSSSWTRWARCRCATSSIPAATGRCRVSSNPSWMATPGSAASSRSTA